MITLTFVNAISQIMLKQSAEDTKGLSFLKKFMNKKVFFAYVLFALVSVGNLFAYRGIDFKYGGVINAVGQLFVLGLSIRYCNEKLTKNRLIGSILIISGIIVFSLN